MEKYIKKYFQNDWFNWNWNFETCKKLLEPIKDNEFIEIFNNNYKKIMTSNNIDEKFNNKNFQAEKIKNIKNFFINARNYTSHYYHSHDKYIKSFKEISRFLTEITKPFVNNDEFNKLSEWEKSEIKIFLLIFIILNNKITYIYKPEWIESKYLKINTKSKFNKIDDSSEYNKILSNSISFLNSYFKSENNYWSNVKYNDLKIKTKKFEINFMNNILYNLLKYHKIQNIFSALDLNYEKHENYYKKISNRNFQNYFLYLKNDNLYKSFSLKTFFYYYIEYKIQNNNNQLLLEMSKEDFNSIIEKIKNSNKTNGIRKEQPKKDFEHLFTYSNKPKSQFIHMLNKTIKKFVNENKSYSYNWYNFNNNDDDNNINLYHKFFKQFYYEMNNNEAFISNIDVNISRLLSQNQLINEEEKIINSITSEEVQEKIFSNNLNLKNFKFKKILESRYKLGMLVNIMFGKDIIPKNESIKTNFLDKKTFSTLIYKMGYKINNEYEDIWNILEYYKCLKKTIMDNDEFKEKFNIDKLSDFIDKLESKKGNQNDFYSFLQDKISKNNKSKNKKYIKVKDDNYKQKYVQFIEFVNKFCEINKFNWKLDNKKFLFKKYKIYQPLIYSQFLLGNYKDSKFKLFYNDTFEIHDDSKSDKYVKIKIDKNISIKELNNNFSNSMNMINNIFIKLYIDQEKEISFSEYLENLKNIDIQIIKFKENLFMLEADMFNFLNENEIESKMTNKNGAQYIEFSKYKHIYNDTNITNSKIKKIYNDFNQLQKDRNALLHIDFNYHNITNKIIEYIKSK